jgi:ATP-dependent RNA helicase DHX57
VVVIIGSTGCGKTTQVPQFIFDEAVAAGHGGRTSLVCTQPRRISATSVAQRVAQERAEPIGSTVGYQIRLESVKSNHTHLLFCTTGARPTTPCADTPHAPLAPHRIARLATVSRGKGSSFVWGAGVLLRRLSEDQQLAGVSHIVVDEVHERSLDSDFLLVLLKEVLPKRPQLKVVLMSATLDAGVFHHPPFHLSVV